MILTQLLLLPHSRDAIASKKCEDLYKRSLVYTANAFINHAKASKYLHQMPRNICFKRIFAKIVSDHDSLIQNKLIL